MEVVGQSMKRREFFLFAVGAASFPLAARAQQTKTPRIGIFNFENPARIPVSPRSKRSRLYRRPEHAIRVPKAAGDRSRLASLAAELVGLKVDVIVAYPTPAVVAVKQVTQDIPIVLLAAGDPVGTGLVASLSRPGGNITGTSSTTAEAGAKTLEVIRDMLPAGRRVAALANAADPFTKSFLDNCDLAHRW